jgi:7-keto-8-aminopelargonate synthetase-like enzyme
MATIPERMASIEAHVENIRTLQNSMAQQLNDVHSHVLLGKGVAIGRGHMFSRYHAIMVTLAAGIGGIGGALTAAVSFANRYLPATHDLPPFH